METITRPLVRVSILAIILFDVAALFARSALELFLLGLHVQPGITKHLSYPIVPLVLLVLLFPYLKREKAQLLGFVRFRDLTVSVIVRSLLLGVTLRLTWWFVNTLMISLGVIASNAADEIARPLLGFACPPIEILVLGVFVMSFMVPIVEELVCRGLILHALLAKGSFVAVTVSSLIFAVLHSPASYWISFYIGIFLALQMLNYGTLWGPLLTHATYNLMTVFDWTCVQVVWNPGRTDPALTVIGSVSALAAILACLCAIFLVSKATNPQQATTRRGCV